MTDLMIRCPYCRKSTDATESPRCRHCGCEVEILGRVLYSARDSVMLSLEALRERRDREAHDFAHEAWGLKHSPEAAAAGLLAAVALGEPVEIARWIRRRRRLNG